MKELLIKIRALFDGKESFDSAGQSVGNLKSRITECMASGSAFGSALGNLASHAITGVIEKAGELVHKVVELGKQFAEGIVNVSEYADKMGELGMRTGQQAADAVVLTQVFRNVGLEAANVGQAVNMLQMALTGVNEEGLPTKDVFDKLGLSLDELSDMSPINALQAIGEKINGLASAAEKTRALKDLFGRSGPTLMPILGDPEAFSIAKTQVGELAKNIQRNTEELGHFADAWGSLDVKKMQFFAGVAEGLAGSLESAGDAINNIDLSKFGTNIGDTLSGLIQVADELQALVDKAKEAVPEEARPVVSEAVQEGIRQVVSALPGGDMALAAVDGLNYLQEKGAAKREEKSAEKDAKEAEKKAQEEAALESQKQARAAQRVEEQKKREAAAAKDLADLQDADRLKSLPLADQKAELDKRAAALDAGLKNPDQSKEQFSDAQKLRLDIEKQRLEVNRKIAEEQKKQADEDKENSTRRDALDLELAIREAQAAGNDVLAERLQWQKQYNDLLKARIDAGDPDAWNKAVRGANASLGDPLARARAIEKEAGQAVQLSSLGRLGMAMGEATNAADTVNKLQELIIAQKQSSQALDSIQKNTREMADKRGGYQ